MPDDNNPYFDLLASDTSSAVRASMAGSVDRNPDVEVRVQKLAKQYGLPVDAVRREQPRMERRAALDAIDYDSLARQYPGTAGMLSDPNGAGIAHDDIGPMKAIESAVKYLVSAPDSKSTLVGDLAGGLYGAQAGAAGAFRAAAGTAAPLLDFLEPVTAIGGNPLRRLEEGFGMIGASAAADQKDAGGQSATWFGGAVSSGVQSLSQNLLALPMAFLPGGQGAALTMMAGQAGGQTYQKDRTDGIGHWTALGHGASDAAIEAATEMLPMAKLLGDVKAGAPLLQTLLKNVALEVPGEQIATALQDFNDWAVNNKGRSFSDYLAARPEAAAQTLIATLVGVGGNVILMRGLQGAADAASGTDRAAQYRASQADRQAQALSEMHTLAEASKLRERDPEAFQVFAQSLTEQSVPALHIDPQALQRAGVDMDALAQALPSVSEQMQQAGATGGDLVIPTAEVLAMAPGQQFQQALIDNARTAPDAMSAAEARTYMQERGDALQAEIAKVLDQNQGDEQFKAGRDEVRAQFEQQLGAAKRFTGNVNTAYASMLADFYATTAARVGLSPQEMAQRYPLQVTAKLPGGLGGQVLEQGDTVEPPERAQARLIRKRAGRVADQAKQAEMLRQADELDRAAEAKEAEAAKMPAATGGAAARPDGSMHRAPGPHNGASIDQYAGALDEDGLPSDREAIKVLRAARGNPDALVTVYRAAPAGSSLRAGDWVSPTRQYAEMHAEAVSDGAAFNIIEQKVRAADLYTDGNSVNELGYQPALDQDARAQIALGSDITQQPSVITLLQGADLTSFIHESGHFFLEVQSDLAGQIAGRIRDGEQVDTGEREILADMNRLLKWFGLQDTPELSALDQWHAMTLDEKREHHEKFARGFEAYAFEGRAPSTSLSAIFQKFRAWMLHVYKSLSKLNVKLDDEVRGVMDRMLASADQIRDAEAARGMGALFGTPEQAGMTPDEFRDYHALAVDATQQAIQTLEARGLKDMQWLHGAHARKLKEMQRRADGVRREVEREVRREVMSQPVYRAWQFLTATDYEVAEASEKERAKLKAQVDAWDARREAAEVSARQAATDAAMLRRPPVQAEATDQDALDLGTEIPRKELKGAALAEESRQIDAETAQAMAAWDQANRKPGTKERRQRNDALDNSADNLFVAIAKLGGLRREEVASQWGLDSKEKLDSGVFGKPVVRKEGGLSLDAMLERLIEEGYILADENGKGDPRDLEEAFDDQRRGIDRHSTWHDYAERARAAAGEAPVEALDENIAAGKLDTTVLREMYGTGESAAWRALSKRRMTSEAAGIHPDVVAETFGFQSGDELVQALAGAVPPGDAIDARTDQVMLERFGDISSPEALQRLSDEAIHSEARSRSVATELAALQRATSVKTPDAKGRNTVDVMAKAAREYARETIARLRVRDVQPSRYAAAETRAARAAEKAFRAGDVATAATEKRNQLIQSEAARAAHDARDEIDSTVAYLKKFGKRPKGVAPDYLDQIEALLERYDLRQKSLKEIDRRKSLREWVESQREQDIDPDIPPELLDGLGATSWKDATIEELRGLRDAVKQIEHLGRVKQQLLTSKKARDFAAARDELVAGLEEHADGRAADTRTPADALGKSLAAVKSFGAAHIKAATYARVFDGGKDGGPAWEYLIRPMNEAGDREATMRAEATQKLTAIMAPVLKGGKMNARRHFRSINRSMTREQVFAMALNMGNEGNIQRMLGGEGWTLQQVQPVIASLSAADLQAVQQIWDHLETYRPLIAAKERRIYGKEPDWVTPQALTITSVDGQSVALRGGYYPIKYDPLASGRAAEFDAAEAVKQQMQGAHISATTKRGFTKARAEEVRGRSLLYSLAGVYSGVNDVIHDLTHHEALIDVNKMLRSDKVDAAIRSTYGPAAVQQFRDWAQAVAAGETGSTQMLDRTIGRLRQGVSIAGLGFNVMSAVMQPLGLTQSIVRVGAGWIGRGVSQYLANPRAAMRKTYEMSEFMANRSRTRFRELNELKNQVEGQTAAREAVADFAYFMMMRCQQMVDTPTWLGAYEKAVSEGHGDERAVALADQAVIDSQGGGQIKDQSAIERGGQVQKLFTVFYSFMNTALNAGISVTMTTPKTAAGRGKLAAKYLLLYTVPAVLGTILKDALTPGGDDDPEKLAGKLIESQLSYLMGLMVVVREFGDVAKIVAGEKSFGYQGPAGLRLVGDAIKMAQQTQRGEFDDSFRKAAVNMLGSMFALPAAQINRMITGTRALAEGETDNPAAIVFGFQR